MSNKHDGFDAEKLFARKQHFCGYRFCPLCGKELIQGEREGRVRRFCGDDSCGFVFYQNPIPAAGAIIVKDDQVLMVKRAHPPRVGSWCLPAGFMEWNEHPSATAIREVGEETGLLISLKGIFQIYTGTDDPRSNAVLILYLADIVSGEMRASDDALDVRFFPFSGLPQDIAFESHIRALADYQARFPVGS